MDANANANADVGLDKSFAFLWDHVTSLNIILVYLQCRCFDQKPILRRQNSCHASMQIVTIYLHAKRGGDRWSSEYFSRSDEKGQLAMLAAWSCEVGIRAKEHARRVRESKAACTLFFFVV